MVCTVYSPTHVCVGAPRNVLPRPCANATPSTCEQRPLASWPCSYPLSVGATSNVSPWMWAIVSPSTYQRANATDTCRQSPTAPRSDPRRAYHRACTDPGHRWCIPIWRSRRRRWCTVMVCVTVSSPTHVCVGAPRNVLPRPYANATPSTRKQRPLRRGHCSYPLSVAPRARVFSM